MSTYYVDPLNGSDLNDGLTFGSAFLTRAQANAVIAEFDTVILCATAVDVSSVVTLLVLNSYWVGANALGVVDGSQYEIDGNGGTDYCFQIGGATFEGLSLKNINFSGDHTPLNDTGASRIRTFNCLSLGTKEYFLHSDATGTSHTYYSYQDHIENCTISFIQAGNSRTSLTGIVGSFIKNCVRTIDTDGPAYDCHFSVFVNTYFEGSNAGIPSLYNCVLYNSAFYVGDRVTTSKDGEMINTIFMNSSSYAIEWRYSNPSRLVILNCCFWNNTSGILGNAPLGTRNENAVLTDPLFADPENDNFDLLEGSPCRDMGIGA